MSLQRARDNMIGSQTIAAHLAAFNSKGRCPCGTEGVAASSGYECTIQPNGSGIDVILKNKSGKGVLHTFHVTQGPTVDIPDTLRRRHFGS